MPSPSYRKAIAWIAENDEPTAMNQDDVAGLISVVLVADLWQKTARGVARDVLHKRHALGYGSPTFTVDPDEPDFLAIALISTGSTYARGPDRDEVVARCARTFRSDWRDFVPADVEVVVNLWDVTGFGSLQWDLAGVFCTDTGKAVRIPDDRHVEAIRVPAPPSKRAAG